MWAYGLLLFNETVVKIVILLIRETYAHRVYCDVPFLMTSEGDTEPH